MPNLFSRTLARLSVGRKLMLIYLLDLTAVIYVSGILINEKFLAIDFARKEVQGNAYVVAVRDSLVDVARLAVGQPDGRASLAPQRNAVLQAEAVYGAGLQTSESSQSVLAALQRLAEAERAPPGDAALAAQAANALARGRDLLTRVGNQSNLILDPDLDSYYTMSLIVLRYPELLELLNGIVSQLHAGMKAPGMTGADARTQYLIFEGRLDATVQGVEADHAEAYAAGGAPLSAALRPLHRQLAGAIEAFRQSSRRLIDEGASPAALAAVRVAQASSIDALQRSWSGANIELDRLLANRIDGLYRRMWLHLGTALTLLIAILGVVTFVARQIARPLRHLSGVADTVRRTGDHRLRASWHSSDEIGRLVAAFNDMLEQLDREREAQKELAASARAADAQRALVESTPIPLVVTSIPGHEVLHANPPAEAWLNGHRTDPWKAGLEAPVRVRFFQALADRGAVDEFEVRWRAGSEPAWAVLSARRVNFQGQDAVLTAFTPINHLKLMERRLELWAKVFEASSEGILIVDADRRVLSANQAFSRATGYDLQDVIGERPGALLGGESRETQFDGLWAMAASRGTWQGEVMIRRRDGSEYPAWLMASTVRHSQGGQAGLSHYILTSIDISDRKKSEERIRFLADHDVLTELPNRALCTERLRQAVQQAALSGERLAVLFIDLDRFKDINDSLGHHIGDGLLRSVSRRLIEAVRPGDTVSRLGGDEFVVLINGVADASEVAELVERRLIPLIRQPHPVDGADLHVSCSVGIAMFPDDAQDIDALMRHADTAMYQAKALGRDGAQFFTAEMTERAQARLQLAASLRLALERQEFVLHWQPRVAARGGALAGVEGLLRWNHPERGLVAPGEFIAAAEESGLIVPIGAWVIEEACRQIGSWRAQGLPEFGVSINLSAVQLKESGLVEQVAACLRRHQVRQGTLVLELTESMVMEDAEDNLRQMHALRALGVKLAIDDFGTGYSSLAYLNRFPIDQLKIDRSFVHDMLGDPTDRAITMAIIGLGHTLGLTVVAEGVEREAEAVLLREAGCDELQGYLFARPMPAHALPGWIARQAEVPDALAQA